MRHVAIQNKKCKINIEKKASQIIELKNVLDGNVLPSRSDRKTYQRL